MNENSSVSYIKDHYPKIIFNPVNIDINKKAIAFIITDTNLLLGYISKNGNFCKVMEPINLNDKTKILELLDKKLVR